VLHDSHVVVVNLHYSLIEDQLHLGFRFLGTPPN